MLDIKNVSRLGAFVLAASGFGCSGLPKHDVNQSRTVASETIPRELMASANQAASLATRLGKYGKVVEVERTLNVPPENFISDLLDRAGYKDAKLINAGTKREAYNQDFLAQCRLEIVNTNPDLVKGRQVRYFVIEADRRGNEDLVSK